MEAEAQGQKRVSIFLIRYPVYKSAKIPRPAFLAIPRKSQKINLTDYIITCIFIIFVINII